MPASTSNVGNIHSVANGADDRVAEEKTDGAARCERVGRAQEETGTDDTANTARRVSTRRRRTRQPTHLIMAMCRFFIVRWRVVPDPGASSWLASESLLSTTSSWTFSLEPCFKSFESRDDMVSRGARNGRGGKLCGRLQLIYARASYLPPRRDTPMKGDR